MNTSLLITDNQSQISNLLTGQYNVTPTSSLNTIQTNAFDVIVVDVVDYEGLKAVQAIRYQSSTVPIILVSDNQTYLTRGLQMGANDYILKPVERELALARIEAQVQQKKLLDERQAEIERLQKLAQQQERLVKILAHDIRNSVGNLRMAQLLLLEESNDSKLLTGMSLSLDAMDSILADYVAAFSLWDDHKEKYVPIAIDEAIQTIIDEYLPSAAQKNIILQNSSKSGEVIADLTQLKQVIRNLVSNAIKYSPANSTVRISSDVEDDRVCMYVVDEVPGIPEKERHLLFTEFGKLSTRPTAHENSTGLGLWIVKNLVEDMGGSVGEDNLPDGGSKFWVKLPHQVA